MSFHGIEYKARSRPRGRGRWQEEKGKEEREKGEGREGADRGAVEQSREGEPITNEKKNRLERIR